MLLKRIFFLGLLAVIVTVGRAELIWGEMDKEAVKNQGSTLLEQIQALIGPTPEKTRKNIEIYLDEAGGSDWRWTNIYILNRLYFAVPTVLKAKTQVFAGWEHGGDPARRPTSEEVEVSGIYPLRKTEHGFELFDRIYSYHGNRYPVLSEFDAFHALYGLRSELSPKPSSGN